MKEISGKIGFYELLAEFSRTKSPKKCVLYFYKNKKYKIFFDLQLKK